MTGPVGRTRATLLAHGPTTATAGAVFPGDQPLDGRGRTWVEAARGAVPRADRVVSAPDRACVETCAGLGLGAGSDARLGDWDVGEWAGRALDDVAAAHPAAVTAWLTDPDVAPHGGESLAALVARVAAWLAAVPAGHTLAVCGPAVVRAAVVAVLGAPPSAFWRLDVAPLTRTDLRGGPDRWTVRGTAVPMCRPR